MRYLILGSSGQVGHHLCDYLRNTGNQVIEFDLCLGPEHDLRLPNNEHLAEAISNCDQVFFLAYDVGGSKYLIEKQKTKEFLDNNIKIMLHTFDAIDKQRKPFVFASSQMVNDLRSSYGSLKAIGEHYTKIMGGVIAKLWNVYGREDIGKRSHVITDFIESALRHKHIKMMTKGDEQRQFLHADDCARGLKTLLDRYNETKGKEYHLTSFEWTSISSLAVMISSMVDGCRVTRGAEEDRLQRDHRLQPDADILSMWKPSISLQEGLKGMMIGEISPNKMG